MKNLVECRGEKEAFIEMVTAAVIPEVEPENRVAVSEQDIARAPAISRRSAAFPSVKYNDEAFDPSVRRRDGKPAEEPDAVSRIEGERP